MFNDNANLRNTLISIATAVVVVFIYHKAYVARSCVHSNELSKLSGSIEPIMWDVIRQNPDAFFKVLNEAAQAQQENVKKDLENTATQAKEKLSSAGIQVGSKEANNVQFFAFIDPMCPVSHEFQKVAFRVIKEKNNISFRFIPVAMLGLNSEVMARFMLAANLQNEGNTIKLLQGFINKLPQMSRQKLLEIAKESGFDTAKIEKGEGDKSVEETLHQYMKLAEELKIQGTPTVYVLKSDGKVSLVPPMDVAGFIEVAQSAQSEPAEKTTAEKTDSK